MAEFDDVWSEYDRMQTNDKARLSLHKASGLNPDEEAEIQNLADKHKVPYTTARRKVTELRRKDRYANIDIDRISQDAPRLAEFLADERNAALSVDDIDALMRLEQEAQNQAPQFNMARGTMKRWAELSGNLVEVVGRGITEMGRATESAIGEYIPEALRGGPDLGGALTQLGEEVSTDVAESYGYTPEFTWDRFKGDMTAGNLAGFIAETGMQSVADMAAAMYTLPAYVASRTEEIAEVRAGDQAPQANDLMTALVPAVTSALLERIGATAVFKGKTATTYVQALKEAGRAGTREGVTEFLQEGVEYLGEEVGTGREVSLAAMLDRQIAGLVAGAGMGAGVRGPTAAIEATVATREGKYRKAVKESIRRTNSASEQDQLDTLLQAAQEPKLAQRAPEKYQELLQQTVNRNAYVNPEVLKQLRDEGAVFPQSVAKQLDGETGADIEVPLTYFVQNPEITQRIRNEIRASETGMTRTEIETGSVDDVRALITEAQKNAKELDRASEIHQQIVDQLVETGRMSEQTARIQAQLIPAYVTTAAKNRGITVDEVYESMGLSIFGPEAPAPKAEESRPVLNAQGITLTEDVEIQETGETVTVEQDAQQVFDRLEKRRNTVAKLRDCLNA